MGFVMWMFTHKLLVFFIGATAAFAIATTVLGVNNTDLISQLDEKNSATSTPMPPTEATPNPPDMSKYRLPRSVTPVTYDLYLYPNLETGLFRGRVLATVTITEPTSKLVLHSNQLKVNGVSVGDEPCAFELDAPYELLTVQKNDNSNFPASSAQVAIDFEGDMRNRIVGLYVSSYNSATGTISIATSKFEPTYARQAFPCFDEPNFKATYRVHLLKPTKPNYIALSNYPETGHEETPEGTLVHFQETVPMSTYLSCFIVSDFVATETEFQNKENKVPFRVYASPNQLEKTRYAGEVGKKVIEYYVDYFDIPFPLPKLDLVAIPDFVSGAMEHWGLVTFRETALLYTSETHSSSNKQRVATVVAHELAHSWFGNLVTLDWWNDLWLNEGFASYIEYKGTLKAEPTWGMLDQFLVDELHPVLSLDATQGSHPIIVTVATPDQITEVFDTISYNKGASVLRMLEYVTGEDNFRKGVTSYLNKFAYKNAVTQDLLNELQTVIGDSVNITEFMNTFTVQMGYPILDVTVTGNKYTFRQKRFLKDPTATAEPNKRRESPLNYKWSVPISYMTDLGTSDITWLLSDANEVSIDIPAIVKWVKFNPSQVGYYRVNYPEAQWRSLITIVNDLPIADRTHLLEESFSIAESGDLSYTVPLDLTKYLVQEVDYVPWNVASATFGQLKKYLTNSQAEADLKTYVIGLLKNAYETLSWEEKAEDEHLKRLARVQVLSLACAMEYDVALAEAKTRFDEWIASGSPLSQDLRSIIYKYGMVKADEATWNKLLEIFVAENDANEKLKLMNGLASVQNPALLIKFLELAKSETYVRSQDYLTLLQYIAANPAGTSIVWDYVRDNWQYLVDRFTLNSRTLGSMIPSISSTFSTETKLDEMRQFFKRYPEAGAGAAARNRALESIENNIKWLSKYKTAVENWLKQNKPDQS